MKFKKSLMCFMIILLTNVGCAMGLEQENDDNTNFKGGNVITEEKALMLAKQYIINKGIKILNINKMRLIEEKDPDYVIFTKEDFREDWIFIVPTTFKVKMLQGLKWGIIYVNRKSGKVTYGGEGPA